MLSPTKPIAAADVPAGSGRRPGAARCSIRWSRRWPSRRRRSTLTKSPVRLGYVYTPNGIIGCIDKSPRPFMWTPTDRRGGLRVQPDDEGRSSRSARTSSSFSGLAQVNGPGARRRSRRSRARDGDLAHRRASVQDRRRGLPARHLGRSDRGEGVRQADAAGVARARRSSSRRSRATATRATPARTCRCRGGPRPARCPRRSIRARCSSGCSATARAPTPARRVARLAEPRQSVLDYVTRQPDASAAAASARATSASSTSISSRCATSSGAFSVPKTERHDAAAAHGAAERVPDDYVRVRQADDGPAGHRLADRHDARHLVHDGPRRQQPCLSRDRHLRRPPLDFAPPAGSRSASRS